MMGHTYFDTLQASELDHCELLLWVVALKGGRKNEGRAELGSGPFEGSGTWPAGTTNLEAFESGTSPLGKSGIYSGLRVSSGFLQVKMFV
jgi:hypothetical protein